MWGRGRAVIPAQERLSGAPIHLSPLSGGRLRGGLDVGACAGGGLSGRTSAHRTDVGSRAQPPTLHLTSPLKGGRDEFGGGDT